MFDVLILGAGPAGSTAANLLAHQGVRVCVIEKEVFPRFHIGESLLPADLPIFARLGFQPAKDRYVYKAGAEFVDERTHDFAEYPFKDGMPGTPKYAWQVERAVFDHDLALLAEKQGAAFRYGCRVRDASVHESHVEVIVDDGEKLTAKYLIDATGQDAFWARKHRLVQPINGFGIVAAFRHFTNLSPESTAELEKTGNIKVIILENGWSWAIPLAGGRLSHGVVTRERGVTAQIVDDHYAQSPLLQRLTVGANRTEPKLIRHFSYFNREPYGARYACIGDAAAFLDPVFSSGVSLGMFAGELLADRLGPALAQGTEADPEICSEVKAKMRIAYVAFGSLIKSFYHRNLVQNFFFHPEPRGDLRSGLISLLAADVWRDDNPFLDVLTRGNRRWEPEHELRPLVEAGAVASSDPLSA